ncbi:MAG: PDZ domain-containing protein [Steroidobacteraceae bacterium]
MNRTILAVMAVAAFCAASPPARAQAEDAGALDKRLEDARQRLEAAAREVAELSAAAAGAGETLDFELLLPAPGRAVLGINLGSAETGDGGVRVNSVSPGGPAAEAGVKAGDLIVAIDAKPVGTGRDLVTAMKDVVPGQKVALNMRRDGKPVTVTVEARSMDQVFRHRRGRMMGAMPPLHPPPPGHPWPPLEAMPSGHGHSWLLDHWADAELVKVTPPLGRYFGADKGVLVARAPVDKALGLEDGDVIVSIGGREPQSGPHAMRILRSYQPGESIEIRILRDRKAQTLKATVPQESTARKPELLRPPPALPVEPPSTS